MNVLRCFTSVTSITFGKKAGVLNVFQGIDHLTDKRTERGPPTLYNALSILGSSHVCTDPELLSQQQLQHG